MPPVIVASRDWRDLKNREELFLRYFRWRTAVHDLDHSHYCKTLTQGMDDEQKCWFSLLFGMTYRTPQAYAYWWTFPDIGDMDIETVEIWNTDNWQRTSYGTDARYNKGHFASQVRSVFLWKGEDTIHDKITALVSSSDPYQNFEALFSSIATLYKFGRMTSWIACQCLYDVLELPIDFDNVLIRNPNDDSSMQSVWNGYCMLKGNYEKLLGKTYSTTPYRVTKDDMKRVGNDMMRYRKVAQNYSGQSVDVFKWESIWCQFKRLFNTDGSREYPGHSSGDAASRYSYYREQWPEVDWSSFREALLSQPGLVRGRTYVNDHNKVFGATGLLLNMHEMYPDMPNAYRKLGIDPNDQVIPSLFTDHGLEVPSCPR